MNKLQKISTGLFVASILITNFSFLASNPVFAAPYDMQATEKQIEKLATDSPIQTPGDISRVFEQIVRWTYYIFFVLAVYFILIAAFSYLTASGDPEKLKKAHSSLGWAFVAIAVALISVGAAQIIKSFITPPGR